MSREARSEAARPPALQAASALSPYALELEAELKSGAWKALADLDLDGLAVRIAASRLTLWVRVGGDGPGVALRTAHTLGGDITAKVLKRSPRAVRLKAEGVCGAWQVDVQRLSGDRPVLRATTRFTPARDMVVPPTPRDLYVLGKDGLPTTARGNVEAAQRGLNGGLVYFLLEGASFEAALYLQDLTSLNPYFKATATTPDGCVGGAWPELGFLPPAPPEGGPEALHPLRGGQTLILSDAILAFSLAPGRSETEGAATFLQLIAAAYPHLAKPTLKRRDWLSRTRRTIRDLERSPKATVRAYGDLYIHPYTASEYPDSMVQVSVLSALRDWERWTGEPVPLADKLTAGLDRFFDPELGSLRRYLPNVGDDKNADAVDSWYLYHPLLNLGRLALQGDAQAARLFHNSVSYAAKAARHFNYTWPIQYDLKTFSVITEARNEDGLGQTDVGGLYAYVMLQAFELTGEQRWLQEATKALERARGMRFELEYQANLTAWGAAACARLWRITEDKDWLSQSYVYLASFLHNCELWESKIGLSASFDNFLGATCLHDAPYMAIYECFDAFCAFEGYLRDGGEALDTAARLLVTEYCRFTLSRAWYYYPDALPTEALAKEQRNGHIDRKLSFPLEDLYSDGQEAGQVGQEIYGCGAAPAFAARSFHRLPNAPFLIYADIFASQVERIGPNACALRLAGAAGGEACLSVLRAPRKRKPLPNVELTVGDRTLVAEETAADRADFTVPADARLVLRW